jgi:cell division protein FtsB
MTFIQPVQRHSAFLPLVVFLSVTLFGAGIALVLSYHRNVDISHRIETSAAEIERIEAENAQLREEMVRTLSSVNLEALAQERHLVKEKNPRYLEVHSKEQWALVSSR